MKLPLLQLAQKSPTVWVVIGDTPNFHLIDVESNHKMSINTDCGLNRALLVSHSLIVTLAERTARFWDMHDLRLMYTMEVSNDTLSVMCIVDE